jgi:hypothetical protein
MVLRKVLRIAPFVGVIVIGLLARIPPASSGSPGEIEAEYRPIQSISYEFGAKFVSGFFMQQAASCLVHLMITEKIDPDEPLRMTATRVRLALSPGQIAGLDSEEGQSLNLKCGEGAETLEVTVGDREKLVALQETALQAAVAESH